MQTQRDSSEPIAVWRGGRPTPIFSSTPLFSSGSLWRGMRLERHRVSLVDDGPSIVSGCLLCWNLGKAGPVTWKVGGEQRTKVIAGHALTLTTHGETREVSWSQPMDLLLLSISPKVMLDSEDRPLAELAGRRGFQDKQMETLLRMLHADALAGSPAGPLYGEQLGVALTVYLGQRFARQSSTASVCRSKLPGVVLQRILDLIEARLPERISLEELSSEARVSRFYFARLFRNSMGISPAQYLLRRRLDKVKQFIETSEMNLREIAGATGFSSHSHLSATFRQNIGLTPSAYLRLCKPTRVVQKKILMPN